MGVGSVSGTSGGAGRAGSIVPGGIVGGEACTKRLAPLTLGFEVVVELRKTLSNVTLRDAIVLDKGNCA